MALVTIICIVIIFAVLIIAVSTVGVIYSRRRAARRRLRAAQTQRTGRPRHPEALPPEENMWASPPAQGTVVVRTADELRGLRDFVRVEAVEDDVESTDVALTRPPSCLFWPDEPHNAAMTLPTTPATPSYAARGAELPPSPNNDPVALTPLTPLTPSDPSRVFGGQSAFRGASARGATDLVISNDAAQSHSQLYLPQRPSHQQHFPLEMPLRRVPIGQGEAPGTTPPAPLTLSASLLPALPSRHASSTEIRTPYEKNLAQHQVLSTAASAPDHDLPQSTATMNSAPLLRAWPSAVIQVPSSTMAVAGGPVVIDHFQTPPANDRSTAASASIPAARPLFARAPLLASTGSDHITLEGPPPPPARLPGGAGPLGEHDEAAVPSPSSSAAFPLSPPLSRGESGEESGERQDASEFSAGKSASGSFALVGGLRPHVNRRQSERIARRLLIPVLEQSSAGGAARTNHSRSVSRDERLPESGYGGGANPHVALSQFLAPATPQPARSLSFAESAPVFFKAAVDSAEAAAEHGLCKAPSGVPLPAAQGPLLDLPEDPAKPASSPALVTGSHPSSRPLSRQSSFIRAAAAKATLKHASTAARGKKPVKRLRHVHRGGFILFEQPLEDGEDGAQPIGSTSRPKRNQKGSAVGADSSSSATASGTKDGNKVGKQPKRYYFEKPSSLEVYGRAAYTDPNADFLASLDTA